MSVVNAVSPSRRTRVGARVGVLLAAVVALVAGVTTGVARADDAGAFTPVDFSLAPPPPQPVGTPITGGTTISGSISVDGLDLVTPPDVQDGFVTVLSYATPGRPAKGEAHLFSRTSGLATMSEAQYAGMVAMENDAVATVMGSHGMSDTPNNHDLVIAYAREDVTVALYARLQQALQKSDALRSANEQQALNWVVAVAAAHAAGAAVAAKAEFDRWQANPCTYRPPAPYTDYTGDQAPYCRGLRTISALPPQDKAPSTDQFVAWGSAAFDAQRTGGRTLYKQLFGSSVSEYAIAFGAAAAFFGTATGVGLTANLLQVGGFGAGPITQAVFPAFAAGLRAPSLLVLTSGGSPAALRLLSTAISNATVFAGAANFLVVLGPALIIASAIVSAVLAGIDAFAAKNTASALDAAVARARDRQPDLRALLGSAAGQAQVFGDLADSVIDCAREVAPGECDIDTALPTRRLDDPVFRVRDYASGEQDGPATVSAPISLGRPGAWSDTRLAIRDGWFVRDDSSQPTQTIRYTDYRGDPRTAHLVYRPVSGYSFQSLLEPEAGGPAAGSGYAAGTPCESGLDYLPCFTSKTLPVRTSDGRTVSLELSANRAPTAPVLGTNRPAAVGLPVALSASLPAGAPADPDGDAVTSSWSVEFDGPCVQTDPADYFWDCGDGSTGDGPHGGFERVLPGGTDTVVWNTPGTYRVTRTVTDAFGVRTVASMDVVVAPAARTLYATCLRCDTSGGKQVQIAGRIGFGAHRDGETVTIDWGDGTSTAGVPRRAFPGNEFLSQTFWARIENSSQYQFQAVHTYASGSANPYRITVTDTDTGDGNPPPVVLTADAAPVADPTSYENVVVDRLVDYPVALRLPVFTDSSGARPAVTCTAPDGFGTTRTVTDFAPFRTGTTTTVTCRATAASGVTGTASFTVTTHQITAHLVASTDAAAVGEPVTYTASGTTDDGRDVGDVTDRITVQSAANGVTCSVRTCSRTSTAGPIVAAPVADDNLVGDVVTTPVRAGDPAAIAVVDGTGRSVAVGTSSPAPWSFVVRDAYGNPVPGAPVTLTVASGTGSLPGGVSTAEVRSDAAGVVAFAPAVGASPGPVVFKALVSDDVVAQFTATAFAGDGLRGVSGNAQRVRVGATPAPLVTRLYDGNNRPLPGVPISVRTVSGPARFAGGATSVSGTTDGSGRFAATLPTATAAGSSVLAVTADGDTVLQTLDVVANAAPVAGADAYTVVAAAGGLRPEASNGVLVSDSDPDGDALTAVLVRGPRHGLFRLAADGSFTYFPKAGFTGTDSFTYTASDGILNSAPQPVSIQVTPATADLGVGLAGPDTIARGKAAVLGVYVVDRGPSAAGNLQVAVQLAEGLSFGTVPDGVTVSADGRRATFGLTGLAVGVAQRVNLQVRAAADAATGGRAVRVTAGAPRLPDPTEVNNVLTVRTSVT